MIEVNLLPGGKKGGSGGLSFSLPDLTSVFKRGGEGLPDSYILFFAAAAVVGLGYIGWAFLAVGRQAEDLQVRLEEQRQDSIRFAAIIQQTTELQARGDSIARRVAIIQEIDADRYTWPHLLDEVAAAVPDYTWLRELQYFGENPLQIRMTGRAGSIADITSFMRRLEASRFLRSVRTENIVRVPSEENPDDLVQEFEFVLIYEPPPIEELETIPLFGDVNAQTADPATTGN